jgi:hypothetical protein
MNTDPQHCLELPDCGIRVYKKLQDYQCCDPRSGIRCLLWPLDPEWVKKIKSRDEYPE